MTDCMFRGREVGKVACGSCAGNVQVKLFQCAVHWSCSLKKAVGAEVPGRYRVCENCPERLPFVNVVQIDYSTTK